MALDKGAIIRPQELNVSADALRLVPHAVAERYLVCPIELTDSSNSVRVLTLATTDPGNKKMISELQALTCCMIEPVQSTERDIRLGIAVHYSYTIASSSMFVPQAADSQNAQSVVDNALKRSVSERATDIHFDPQGKKVFVRFRIDGFMCDQLSYDMAMHHQVISRLKVQANLDISQTRLPQDGRFEWQFVGRTYDIRLAIAPTFGGEKAALRILPKGEMSLGVSQLGLTPLNRELLEHLIARPFGMVLATGPTGAGKTTTLYACLSTINCIVKNVVTIEDPIEYQFSRVNQIQANPRIGLTFAAGLRAILRIDPDIILVGEIRDQETLEIAIHSALTGHMVLSTMHCNDAASGATRMIDMGTEPFLITSSVSGIIAQRLVRKICLNCKEEMVVSAETRQTLKLADDDRRFYQGKGCQACRGTGYLGRMGLYEIMPMLEPIQKAIMRNESSTTIREIMDDAGIPNLRSDGVEKARAGITTLEEVMRVVNVEIAD